MNQEKNFELSKAIRENDISQAKKIIIEGRNTNSNAYDVKFLTNAILQENVEIIQTLLDSGVFLDKKDEEKDSFPITLACRLGNIEIVELLVHAGAYIDLNGYDSPLWAAISSNNIHVADFLIRSEADITIRIDNNNILGLSAARGFLDGVILIIEAAIRSSIMPIPELLHINFALHQAAINGEEEVFNYLSRFCSGDDIKYLEQTLRLGVVERSRRENKFISNFVKAIENNNIDLIQEAISSSRNENINFYTDKGLTPLHVAISQRNPEIVNLLLRSGIDYELCDENFQWTPLFEASNKIHQPEIVEALLCAGASVETIIDGVTALQVAISSYIGIVRTPKGLVLPSFELRRERALKVISLLIKFGANVDFMDIEGVTPLMLSAQTGDIELIQLLIQSGAKTEILDVEGKTFMDYASPKIRSQLSSIQS
jgi:uncharacterized protein